MDANDSKPKIMKEGMEMDTNDSKPKIMKEIIRICPKMPQGVMEAPPHDANDIVPDPIDVCVEKSPASYAPVLYADYDESQHLIYCPVDYPRSIPKGPAKLSDGFSGEYFFERGQAVYYRMKDDSEVKVIDAILRVVGIKALYSPDGSHETFVQCSIHSDWLDDGRHQLEVPLKNFKKILAEVHHQYPSISIMKQYAQTIEEYLSCIFKNRPKDEVIKGSRYIGWYSFSQNTQYYIGGDPFYHGYQFPEEPLLSAPAYTGQRFLAIGNGGAQIATLWIAAHLAFLLYWYDKVSIHFHSVIYLQGETNAFKTSVCKLISNVFNPDRDRAVVRLNSTKAGIQKVVSYLPDTLVCLDDFSNTETSSRTQAKDVAESVLRAVGDGQFAAKMDMSKSSSVIQDAVRTVIVMTGEETIGLSQSSEFRMITIPVQRGVFEAAKLQYFEDRPSEIPQYFTSFIRYLEQAMPYRLGMVKERFRKLRQFFRTTMETPRLAEAKAILMLTSEIIDDFYTRSSADGAVSSLSELFKAGVDEIFSINTRHSQRKASELLFLEAVCAISSTKALPIAENELCYVENSTYFAGFKDTDGNLWLQPDRAYAEVVKFFRKRHIDFLADMGTVKKRLYEGGISIGRYDEKGNKYEYLRRGHRKDASGLRKRFLVIKHEKIEEFLAKEEE